MFSNTKDTISFLQCVDGLHVPKGALLVTIDAECLYNSIPRELGLETIKTYLDQMGTSSSSHNELIL